MLKTIKMTMNEHINELKIHENPKLKVILMKSNNLCMKFLLLTSDLIYKS